MILQSLVILLIGKILIFQQQKKIINNLKLDNEDIKLNILELKDDEKGSKSIIIRKKKHCVFVKKLDSLLNYSSSESESESKS